MEQKQPGISIIVPVYNVEKYIHQCIDSILNQSFMDYELILVDDGSPDNCPQILDAYAERDNRIKVIHQKNGGVSRARNAGIDAAKGKWLYFVDSDDWLLEDSVAALYNYAEATNADVVFTDCVEQYDGGRTRRIKMFSEKFVSSDRDLILKIQKSILCHQYSPFFNTGADNAYPAPWSKIIRAQLVTGHHIEYNPSVKGIYDDGLFTVEVLEWAQKVAYNMNCVYNYRILSNSIVHAFKKDMISKFELNCFEMDRFIEKYHKDNEFKMAEDCRRVAYLSSMLAVATTSKTPVSKKEFKEIIGREPWKKSIANANLRHLEGKHKVTAFLLRIKSFFGIRLYGILKQKKAYQRGKRILHENCGISA